jgi:hypothetical protein
LGHDLWLVDATIVRANRSAAGAQKHPHAVPKLAGPLAAQLTEPLAHAPRRSRGGFGRSRVAATTSSWPATPPVTSPGRPSSWTASGRHAEAAPSGGAHGASPPPAPGGTVAPYSERVKHRKTSVQQLCRAACLSHARSAVAANVVEPSGPCASRCTRSSRGIMSSL